VLRIRVKKKDGKKKTRVEKNKPMRKRETTRRRSIYKGHSTEEGRGEGGHNMC